MNIDESEDPIVIEVYAKQFAWQARYAGADNTLGLGNVNFIDETNNPIGVDMTDAASLDDKPVSELHLPKGKKYYLSLDHKMYCTQLICLTLGHK